MPVRNQNWYDLQAGRKYPLDDDSTCIDDSGNLLRNDLIVDCNIRFPDSLGDTLFVQAITVTENIVTVLIGAAAAGSSAVSSVGAISLPKPITPNVNYSLTPLAAGVAGWVVFGSGISDAFSGRYATPAQTKIAARNAASYAALPVQSLRKYGLARALTDVITVTVEAPIVAEKQTVTINGKPATAVVFRLDAALGDFEYNPLSHFLGPCGMRPESGTCPAQPIETINGVTPDCNGNIIIIGDSVDIYPFENCGGFGLDIGLGLGDACKKTPYGPPREPQDNCEPSSSSSTAAPSPSSSSSSATQVPSPSSSTSSVSSSSATGPLRTLPMCEPFTGNTANVVTVKSGSFSVKSVVAGDDTLEKCGPG